MLMNYVWELKALNKSYLLPDFKTADFLPALGYFEKDKWASSFPNITISLRLVLTLFVTYASCERSFSELNLIKIYLLSQIRQERLTNPSNILYRAHHFAFL